MKFLKTTAALTILLLALTGCSRGSNIAPADFGNTDGNITNLGGACEKDGSVYYQDSKDYSLYKVSEGSEPVKLNSDPSYFINVMGDYVYYVNENDSFHVYRMKTDGSENQKIIDYTAYYMTVYKDSIYFVNYSDNQNIYKADIDGGNCHKIVNSICYYPVIAEDKLYYIDYANDNSVVETDLEGENKHTISDSYYAAYLNYDDGALYYTNAIAQNNKDGDDFLYRTDIASGKTTAVISIPCADINIAEGRIYYKNLKDEKIYSCNTDGKDTKEISDANGVYINIANNKIYYLVRDDENNLVVNSEDL